MRVMQSQESVFSARFWMIGVRPVCSCGDLQWPTVSWHVLIGMISYNNEKFGMSMESMVFAFLSFVF